MSLKSQVMNMKALYTLLSQDLGYIYGERESGPNGAKPMFLTRGRAFLNALGHDLGFEVQRVYTNKAGIVASGEVYLRGMWDGVQGLYVEISQPTYGAAAMHYGEINAIDGKNGRLARVTLDELRAADYAGLMLRLLDTRTSGNGRRAA